ncbi:NAD(P)/FAD-dependent oxidoreductase [Acidocella sp.]|uniref:flavin-containing monooxygenase n=1 Tax=Acidocella sp. TaxID=50710 RepID=UPI00260E7057|nr:NAD(P)/FAD-dependent oxidoreductase [Acidocella sp.]
MTCQPTQTPPPESFNIPALREKYLAERDKRLNVRATAQYVRAAGEFVENYEADPHMPVLPRAAVSEELDVAILGAGWTGILSAYHLKQAGVSTFRHIDHAGDFGGVWYWNRYPGIQCDNDAYCYLPLLEETGFMPSKKFSDGFEIYDYCRLIAERFGFYETALFHTLVTTLRWDETIQRWRILTNRGDEILARFVVMAGGLLNIPKLPGIPGIGDFTGKMFHTARWDYEYTGGSYRAPVLDRLADKRVAIIGTGATAIQATPYLGQYAKTFYVLQRTPSTVDERKNNPTDPEWVKTLQPGWQKARQINFLHAAMERLAKGEEDQICDIWTEINRNLNAQLAAENWPELTLEQWVAKREMVDYQVMERLRHRVETLVEDKATAEALKPWYRFLCKRPASNDDYYPTFNRPGVKLIDVSASQGVERMTEKGFVAGGVEYEIDCMIFASGFEVTSDLDRRWGIDVIEGRGGKSIYDHWRDGYKTLHGMMTHGFPNQFFTGFIQSGLNASTTEQMSRHGYHIAYIIKEALTRGATMVEASEAAQAAYVQHVHDTAVDISAFQRECTPSYFNGEGDTKPRFYAGEPYGPGWEAFETLLADWRDKGDLAGVILTTPAAAALAPAK